MKNKLISIVLLNLVCTLHAQAPVTPITIYGQVCLFYPDSILLAYTTSNQNNAQPSYDFFRINSKTTKAGPYLSKSEYDDFLKKIGAKAPLSTPINTAMISNGKYIYGVFLTLTTDNVGYIMTCSLNDKTFTRPSPIPPMPPTSHKPQPTIDNALGQVSE